MALSDNIKSRKRLAASDVVLAFVLVSVSVLMTALQFKNTGNTALKAVVKKNGVTVQSVVLQDREPYEMCIDEEYNIILYIEKNGVTIARSDCADKICVNTGKITKPGQTIVCLPARVSVELQGVTAVNELDGVTR
ncbi:MAG: NusG domain II-containing protein [Clostridia bacterium]|nr:NusG domain II-containing protein [Clostridia bacterium]